MNSVNICGWLSASDVVCNLYIRMGFVRHLKPQQLRAARWRHGHVSLDTIAWFTVEIKA